MAYSSIPLESLQTDVKTRLQAVPYLAGVPIMLENDPAYTADDIAKVEGRFEGALNQYGLVLVILSPLARGAHDISDFSHITVDVMVPVAVIENPAANLSGTGFGKPPLRCVGEIIKALVSEYRFDGAPFEKPEFLQGLHAYYVKPAHLTTFAAP